MSFTFDGIVRILEKGARRVDGDFENYTITAYRIGKMIRIDLKPRGEGRGWAS